MAKNNKNKPPDKPVKWGTDLVQQWLDFGGGKAEGKGGPVLQGTDPRNQGVEPDFRWEGDTMVETTPPQYGLPEMGDPKQIKHYPPLDTSRPSNEPGVDESLAHLLGQMHDNPNTLGTFTPEQLVQLLHDLYGSKGGIARRTNVLQPPPREGYTPSLTPPGGLMAGRLHVPLPSGLLSQTPTGQLPSPNIMITRPDLSPMGHVLAGRLHTPIPSRKELLRQLALKHVQGR